MKAERFIKEYANYKIKDINTNQLIQIYKGCVTECIMY